jgi:hypothetical protein
VNACFLCMHQERGVQEGVAYKQTQTSSSDAMHLQEENSQTVYKVSRRSKLHNEELHSVNSSPYHHQQQLLRIWPCDLFQFRITSEIINLFRHLAGLLGRRINPTQGLCLHRTAQHRKTRTNIHAFTGTPTRDPSSQPAKTHAPDRAATEVGTNYY